MTEPKCILEWEGNEWVAPPGFVVEGQDGCLRKVCGFTTCYNFGKGFDEPYRLTIRGMTEQELIERLGEIVLEIRGYLLNTEFAPEPFTEPVDVDVLLIKFPYQILNLIKVGQNGLAENKGQELKEQIANVLYSHNELTLIYDGVDFNLCKKIYPEKTADYLSQAEMVFALIKEALPELA